jgi:hypothetical protein
MTAEYARLADAAGEVERTDPDTGEVTGGEEFALALASITDAIEKKAEGCAIVLAQLEQNVEFLRAEEKRLAFRRYALEENVKRLRDYVRDALMAAGMQKLKTARYTISVAKPRMSVDVTSVGDLPAQYTTITVTAKKAEIKKALDAGESVPGATLKAGEPSLVIR